MPRKPVFELYQDAAGEWRWRLVVSNGNIIADSGEGYRSKQGAKRGIKSVKNNAPSAEIVVSDRR
ncbi:HVO_2922 family protein [Halegenticoccus tardaugens]|uniref:HVO_2922 family protein n=1 Tax=Halegenticoccus tardaugens TaxID=2071624 RepID=UPI00100B267D|nr:HVO_2922 family protein [Halegenticoccus tardaugens]